MKFLIVGVGAIGGAYLAFLTRAGHEAVGLVKRGRSVDRLSVRGIWGEFEVSVKTVEEISKLMFTPDIIIVSVKSYDTLKVLELIEPAVGEDTLIMIAQNGYGNYEAAVERYGEGKVILARVIFGSRVLAPGVVEITVCADDVVIGDPAGILSQKFLIELAHTFSNAGIPTRYEREVYKYLWDKIIYNCALNPLGALLEVNYGALASNPYTRELMNSIIEEVFEVVRAAGIETFWKDAEDYKKVFYEKLIPPTAAHFPSMLADIKKGRTEIDALNGAICMLGEEHRVLTPVNRVITELVKAKEVLNRES